MDVKVITDLTSSDKTIGKIRDKRAKSLSTIIRSQQKVSNIKESQE